MRGKFGNRVSARFAGNRPTRTWVGISSQFLFSSDASGKATLVQLQAPTDLSNLTSDPPEDLTVLRIRGSFSVTFTAAAAATRWTLGLIVQDTDWSQSATFVADADKRWLWTRTFQVNAENTTFDWFPPGAGVAGTTTFYGQPGTTDLDIAPKVKIEPGKALYLVAYENVASARTLTVGSADMRMLFQRTRRRR